jgi:hypothetical protein
MDPVSPGRPDEAADLVSRRQLLRLAGSVGLAAATAACSNRPVVDSASSSPLMTGASSSATQNPIAPGATDDSVTASQPSEPIASPTSTVTATTAVLLCRDAWGARPARPGGRAHTITRMTIHHTGVVLGDNRKAIDRLRQHQRYHQDERGWIDIAYHVGVDRNGDIFELRTPELAGDTATDYDTNGHFLVVCEGDFDKEATTEAQLHGAAFAFAWAAQNFGVTSGTLAGHRDVAAATTCPGADLYAHVSSGDLKRRIDDVLAAGPVNLQRICGPDAAAIVAAIEAGRRL